MVRNKFTCIKDFCLPIIAIIRDNGGEASTKHIYAEFLSRHGNELDESYFTESKDNDIKWRDYVNRAGYYLRDHGYIARPRHGIWELTDKPAPGNTEQLR